MGDEYVLLLHVYCVYTHISRLTPWLDLLEQQNLHAGCNDIQLLHRRHTPPAGNVEFARQLLQRFVNEVSCAWDIHTYTYTYAYTYTYICAGNLISYTHKIHTHTHSLTHRDTPTTHSLSPSSHLHNDRRHADTRPLILDPLRASSGREVGSAPLNMSPTRW